MAQQINLFDPALLRKRDWLALANVMHACAAAAGRRCRRRHGGAARCAVAHGAGGSQRKPAEGHARTGRRARPAGGQPQARPASRTRTDGEPAAAGCAQRGIDRLATAHGPRRRFLCGVSAWFFPSICFRIVADRHCGRCGESGYGNSRPYRRSRPLAGIYPAHEQGAGLPGARLLRLETCRRQDRAGARYSCGGECNSQCTGRCGEEALVSRVHADPAQSCCFGKGGQALPAKRQGGRDNEQLSPTEGTLAGLVEVALLPCRRARSS